MRPSTRRDGICAFGVQLAMLLAVGSCFTVGDRGVLTGNADTVKGRLDSPRYVDNQDGTITDTRNGLTWEQKDGSDGVANYLDPHDVDNVYTWSATGTVPDGAAFTDFLGSLNTCVFNGDVTVGGFAGHCDWRLPTHHELLTLDDRANQPNCPVTGPCIDAIFLPVAFQPSGPPGADAYWSSTSDSPTGAEAWSFSVVSLTNEPKTNAHRVRAVRNQ